MPEIRNAAISQRPVLKDVIVRAFHGMINEISYEMDHYS